MSHVFVYIDYFNRDWNEVEIDMCAKMSLLHPGKVPLNDMSFQY